MTTENSIFQLNNERGLIFHEVLLHALSTAGREIYFRMKSRLRLRFRDRLEEEVFIGQTLKSALAISQMVLVHVEESVVP